MTGLITSHDMFHKQKVLLKQTLNDLNIILRSKLKKLICKLRFTPTYL